jgi:uncharacterized protein
MKKTHKVMRILIVDDVPAAHLLYKHALKRENYEIYDAERGKEALSIINKTELDLIILDIDLPDISGLEVLEELRKTNKEIPVIILTAYGIKDYVIKAASKGVNFYLVKPVELAFLRKRVEDVLNPDEGKFIQIKASSRVLMESLSEFEHDENMSENVKELKSQIKEIASKLGEIEKNKKTEKGVTEDKFFTKEVICPICANDFKGVNYKQKSFKFLNKESDFHEVFEGGNPIMYDIWVCPNCHYAAKKEEFSKIKVKEIEKITNSRLERIRVGKGIDFIKIRDYESSIASYKLAILCYEKMESRIGDIGNLYMKMAWIAREKKKKDDEQKYLKIAIEKFEEAIENKENFAGQLSEIGNTYLMGELYRRVGKYDKAEEYLKTVIESEAGAKEKNILKMAAAQYEQLKLERTQKGNEDNS